LRFVGAAQSRVAPTNAPRIKGYISLLSPQITHSYPRKKGLGSLGHLPKIALLTGEGFDLKSFGGEVVESKKMLFQTYFEVLMVG
jgi:hypothetical protein